MHPTTVVVSLPVPRHPTRTPLRADQSSAWSRPRLDSPRPRWMQTHVATAAWVLLTLVGSVVTVAPPGPGRLEEDPAFLPAPSEIPATPASASGPVVAFLWQADGGPEFSLDRPTGAAIDLQGNLWVTDGANDRFVIFSPDGIAQEAWGTPGRGEGEFAFACRGIRYGGVAFDAAGTMYVADAGNQRIQKFGPDRTFLTSWPSAGIVDSQLLVTGRGREDAAEGQPRCPVGLAVDGQGRVYVSDRNARKIEVFDPDGRPLATGTEASMLPEGVALDGDGNLWVADTANRVLKFSPEGNLLAEWDRYGTGDGEFNAPMGMAVDAWGRVFVSDRGQRVQVFSPDGAFLGGWGSPGSEPGQFSDPVGLALDGVGHLYVVEHYGNRVQKFRLLPPLGPG